MTNYGDMFPDIQQFKKDADLLLKPLLLKLFYPL